MAPVEFEVRVWRNYYDQVNILGQYLKDSKPDEWGNPPKHVISDYERKRIERDIEQLLSQSDKYLDRCKIYANERAWTYDRNNKTTWSSSHTFLFHHLMPKKRHMIVAI